MRAIGISNCQLLSVMSYSIGTNSVTYGAALNAYAISTSYTIAIIFNITLC